MKPKICYKSRLSGIIRDMRRMLQDIYIIIVTVLQLLWLYTRSMSPLALEAACYWSSESIGMALSEVLFISRSLHCGDEFGVLTPGTW